MQNPIVIKAGRSCLSLYCLSFLLFIFVGAMFGSWVDCASSWRAGGPPFGLSVGLCEPANVLDYEALAIPIISTSSHPTYLLFLLLFSSPCFLIQTHIRLYKIIFSFFSGTSLIQFFYNIKKLSRFLSVSIITISDLTTEVFNLCFPLK